MRLEHAALWTDDLERLRDFYVDWFGGAAGPRHEDPRFGFASYFIAFDGGARLELMRMPGILPRHDDGPRQRMGLVHLAFDAGSPAAVDALAARLAAAGHRVVDAPHRTSDGYYEATVLDPDGNRIEIAAAAAPA